MANVAGRVADGDPAVTVTPMSDRDVLGTAFQRMVQGLASLLGETRAAADGVDDTARLVRGVTEQATQAVLQVSDSVRRAADGAHEQSIAARDTSQSVQQLLVAIDDVARGAEAQAHDVSLATHDVEEMAAGVDRVAGVANEVAVSGRASRETAERGADAIRGAVAGMTTIEAVVSEAADRVGNLGRLGDRIGEVVGTIDDIAEQTNLLALNAAIEAARAGEHGRGFAVVADEVRKLAERSQRETKAIADLIREVQGGTKAAITAMQTGAERVRGGAQQADEAGRAIAEILAVVDSTVSQVESIAESAQDLSSRGRAVSDAMVRISAAVEESSATAEEMAAAADEVARSVEGIQPGCRTGPVSLALSRRPPSRCASRWRRSSAGRATSPRQPPGCWPWSRASSLPKPPPSCQRSSRPASSRPRRDVAATARSRTPSAASAERRLYLGLAEHVPVIPSAPPSS
jgi:methyl-accepting chemotaxis protein